MKLTTYTSLRRNALFAAALAAATLDAASAVAQTTPSSEPAPGRASTVQTPTDAQRAAPAATQSDTGTYGGTTNPVPGRNTTPTHPDATDYSTSKNPAATGADPALTPTGRETTSNKLSWLERRWVTKVADSGTSEVELAELATEQATNPDVKKYAQMLVDAHTKLNEELKSLASLKGVKLDTEDLGSERAFKRLSKKTDMEFDREFVEHMIDGHESTIKLFEKASTDAKDADLRAFAAKHVESLRTHLQEAETLRTTIMPTGRTEDATKRALDNTPVLTP
ncbi:MAG: DUF4142 domain-containing protein [Verrucomicrobiota bacterium]